MWIAKPLAALSPEERNSWIAVQESLRSEGEDIPLAQTLTWAEATEALGGRAFVVFSPDERAGGIVHSLEPGHFECVNGPILAWDEEDEIGRQLATFAMATSKMARGFESLSLKPRWDSLMLDHRLAGFPVEPSSVSEALTIHVPIRPDEEDRRRALSKRMQRALAKVLDAGASVQTVDPGREEVREFAERLGTFGKARGFFVPTPEWFETLVFSEKEREEMKFLLIHAALGRSASTRILVCVRGGVAHYLFGCEEREESARSAISTATLAHFHALNECARLRVGTYDLNGFIDLEDPASTGHPYRGVASFKAQFAGECVAYVSPEFRIVP